MLTLLEEFHLLYILGNDILILELIDKAAVDDLVEVDLIPDFELLSDIGEEVLLLLLFLLLFLPSLLSCLTTKTRPPPLIIS